MSCLSTIRAPDGPTDLAKKQRNKIYFNSYLTNLHSKTRIITVLFSRTNRPTDKQTDKLTNGKIRQTEQKGLLMKPTQSLCISTQNKF